MSLSSDQLGQAIDYLRPNADYGLCDTYEHLVSTWRDTKTTVPSEAELEGVWVNLDKHIRKLAVDEKYNTIYINLDRAFAAANRLGNPTTHLIEKSTELLAAHKAEKVAIDNE